MKDSSSSKREFCFELSGPENKSYVVCTLCGVYIMWCVHYVVCTLCSYIFLQHIHRIFQKQVTKTVRSLQTQCRVQSSPYSA